MAAKQREPFVQHAPRSSSPWRPALAVLLLALWTGLASAAGVAVLQVRDAIGPATADYVVRGIAKAAEAGDTLVILELDTPGGLDHSMRDIIRAIMAARVPVAVYVSPQGARAASAGTYILYAAHVAAMAPATTLGAATPVAIGFGGDKPHAPASGGAPPDTMTAKQVHDAAALIRGLAQQRGRNAEWAERAVREAVSLTANEAVREHVADFIARDRADLLAQADGRTVRVGDADVKLATRGLALHEVPPDWRQRLLAVIANPSFALILLMVGMYGLLLEFSHPGFGVAGVTGAICLLLALFALQLLPVNYAGVALVLLGMGLLAAEVVAPTFGVRGGGGIVALVAGGLLLFDRDVPGYGVPLPLVLGVALASAAVVLGGGSMALRARRRPVVSGAEELVGAEGVVLAAGPAGTWAQVHGERWQVRGPGDLAPGERVRVAGIDGLRLEVRRAAAADKEVGDA
jgi:membrane-bound serine protease (ClpP class)